MQFALKYHCFVPKTWLSFNQVTFGMGYIMFTNGFKSTSIAFAITLFSTASYSWLADSPNEFQHCGCPSKQQLNSAHHFPSGSCQVRAANQSWLSWLTGNSRSSQFHYLDLLELLESGKQKSQSNYTSHIH